MNRETSGTGYVKQSTPFAEPAEYWSVCLPAFSPDAVHREG